MNTAASLSTTKIEPSSTPFYCTRLKLLPSCLHLCTGHYMAGGVTAALTTCKTLIPPSLFQPASSTFHVLISMPRKSAHGPCGDPYCNCVSSMNMSVPMFSTPIKLCILFTDDETRTERRCVPWIRWPNHTTKVRQSKSVYTIRRLGSLHV
jgi:hypothetical protein